MNAELLGTVRFQRIHGDAVVHLAVVSEVRQTIHVGVGEAVVFNTVGVSCDLMSPPIQM